MNNLKDIVMHPHTLNIFCDASETKKGENNFTCYGAVAVSMNQIIDSIYRINAYCTSNNGEAKAVLAGLYLAAKYRNDFDTINIFSDSQVTIFGIRDRYDNWECRKGIFYTKQNTPVSSQEIFYEMKQVIKNYNLTVNFFHQKGHVKLNESSLQNAREVFYKSNGVSVDMNFIHYISAYNNIVDETSRNILFSVDLNNFRPIRPLYYRPIDYYN